MAATLITLAEAKDHLRLTWPEGDPQDADLQSKMDDAEAVIVDYLKSPDATAWIGDRVVRAAILLELGVLWRFRGDDLETHQQPRPADGYLDPTITSLLHRKRMPAIA